MLKDKEKNVDEILSSIKFLLVLGPKILSFLGTDFETAVLNFEFLDCLLALRESFVLKRIFLFLLIDFFFKHLDLLLHTLTG